MHPKEFKQEKAGTGRLTHISLPNSEIIVGIGFDENPAVQRLLADPTRKVVLLYPGEPALDPAAGDVSPAALDHRELTILILDATWSGARKMLRLSPSLHSLPRLRFTASQPSRYVIKQQPDPGCLSTLEAVHETLLALASAGIETYQPPFGLLELFARMQQRQIDFASDPNRVGYRHRPYTPPAERVRPEGRSGRRRNFTGVEKT